MTWIFSELELQLGKGKASALMPRRWGFYALFFLIFDHMFWLLRKAEYTEHTEIMGLFVLFSLQNQTQRTKKHQKNEHLAVGVVRARKVKSCHPDQNEGS